MRISHRPVLAVAATLAMAGALTACGSSSSGSSTTSAPPSASASESVSASASEDTASAVASDEASVDPSASGPTMPDVCTLLSAADIAGIIGKDPGVGTPGDGVCIYDSVKLNLGIAPADLYETALDSAKSDDQVAGIKDIAGIGDAAVYVTQKDDANAVLAKQGDYTVVAQGPFDQDQLSSLVTGMFGALM